MRARAFVLTGIALLTATGSLAAPRAVADTASQQAIPASGLVGHWPLDFNAHDTSGHGNNGVIRGAIPAAGVKGGAYWFDGNASIDLPHFSFPSSTYTVSIWMLTTRSAVVDEYRSVFSQLNPSAGGPFELDLGRTSNQASRAEFNVWNGGVTVVQLSEAGLDLRDGRWHMITGTYTDGRQRLYIDGALLKATTFTGPVPTNRTGAAIGGQTFGPYHHPWIGRLDEAVIYDRALSKVEVLQLYQATNPPPPG